MFRRALILAIFLTVASLGLALFHYTKINPSHLAEYSRLKSEKAPRVLQREPALQKRQGVRKDFWIPKKKTRAHTSIESAASELILIDRSGKFEATELLQNLSGEFRDEKALRRFSAEEGTYFFPSHRFIGKNAAFAVFQDNATLLQGTAEKTNLSLIAKSPQLFADRVECLNSNAFRITSDHAAYQKDQLELTPSCRLESADASLDCKGPLTLHLQEKLAETGCPFHYEDKEFRIDANSGKLLYTQEKDGPLSPQTIQCEGGVRLASTENYALADELVYFPQTKKLHLFARKANRVLFWKTDGSIQISAPEVSARLGESEEIKGIGDVHFTFDMEEENRIETLFGKYLE